jgi:hypothetical protein
MIKKKVSKSIVSSNKSKSSHDKKSSDKAKTKKVSDKNISHNSQTTKKNISVATKPVVEQKIVETPIVQQQSIQEAAKPSIAQVQDKSNVQSIFVDDTKEPKAIYVPEPKLNIPESKKYPERESKAVKIIGTILCCIVILFWLMVLILSTQISNGPYTVEKNISTISKVPVSLIFDERLSTLNTAEVISLYGYLRKEITIKEGNGINSSTLEYYIMDDNGKKIAVIIKPSQKIEYERLFTNNSNVKTTYNVTGVYRYSIGKYIMEADSIKPYSKTYIEKTESRIENVTIDVKRGITFNVTKGWTKISAMI